MKIIESYIVANESCSLRKNYSYKILNHGWVSFRYKEVEPTHNEVEAAYLENLKIKSLCADIFTLAKEISQDDYNRLVNKKSFVSM